MKYLFIVLKGVNKVHSRYYKTMKVTPIRVITDNYMYLIEDTTTGLSGIVDPVTIESVSKNILQL